jgi:hypothetical protein
LRAGHTDPSHGGRFDGSVSKLLDTSSEAILAAATEEIKHMLLEALQQYMDEGKDAQKLRRSQPQQSKKRARESPEADECALRDQ